MKTRKSGAIRIGGGSGFLNDRVDAALELVEKGNIDVLMMETLAERTLALLHVARRKGGPGYGTILPGGSTCCCPRWPGIKRNSLPMRAAPRRSNARAWLRGSRESAASNSRSPR